MKIKKQKISDFLKKINMDGTEKIEEAIFDFSETGLKVSAMSPSKVNRIDAVLKTAAFTQYNAVGKIGVQTLSNIIKIVDKFNDDIVLEVEGNLLTVKDKSKNMVTELVDVQFIEAIQPLKEMQFDDFFTMEVAVLKSIIDDATINKEFKIKLETVPKGVKFSNTGKYKFTRNIVVDESKGGVEGLFGQPFVNAIKSLNGKLEMNVKNNFPLKLLEKTEDSVITIIVAPTME